MLEKEFGEEKGKGKKKKKMVKKKPEVESTKFNLFNYLFSFNINIYRQGCCLSVGPTAPL